MINFYYDNIFNNIPLPNCNMGGKFYDKKINVYGYNTPIGYPVTPTCNFYFLSRVFNASPILFTKEQSVDNLYYPIELRTSGTIPITSLIPKKSKKRLQKGKMKVLLFCLQNQGLQNIKVVRYQIDCLKKSKIKNITLVTSEMTGVYSKYFADVKLLSFDYWQVASQVILKNKNYKHILGKNISDINPLDVDFKNLTPNNPYFSFDRKSSYHRLCLLSELSTLDIPKNFNYLKNNPIDYYDPLIFNKFRNDQENYEIIKYIKYYNDNEVVLDETLDSYYNSLINIHTQEYAGNSFDLPEDINSVYTDYGLWFNIAMGKPFIIVGSHQILRYLNNEGYFTFPNVINEEYDRIASMPLRVQAICKQINHVNQDIEKYYNTFLEFSRYYEVNRAKVLGKDHLPRFINLYDSIQYR